MVVWAKISASLFGQKNFKERFWFWTKLYNSKHFRVVGLFGKKSATALFEQFIYSDIVLLTACW